MQNSKGIAGLVGPVIVAMVASEFPLVQPHLYNAQIPPVVYLSGTLLFVGGPAIVRAHNSNEFQQSVQPAGRLTLESPSRIFAVA
jgi:hypothetical protein